MTQIDKIKTEIERKLNIAKYQAQKAIEENNYEAHLQWNQQITVCDELLKFLDTLEEQEVDLEFCKTHCKGYRETGGKCFFDGSCDAKRKATQDPEVDLEDEISNFIEMVDARTNGRWCEEDIIECARHFYELGQCSSGNTLKIKGWVAREIDGSLWLFNEKPKKREHKDGGEAWFGFGFFPLENLYPELSCKDDPIEVELTIKKI